MYTNNIIKRKQKENKKITNKNEKELRNNNYRVTFKELANKYMKKSIFEKYNECFFTCKIEALVFKSTHLGQLLMMINQLMMITGKLST